MRRPSRTFTSRPSRSLGIAMPMMLGGRRLSSRMVRRGSAAKISPEKESRFFEWRRANAAALDGPFQPSHAHLEAPGEAPARARAAGAREPEPRRRMDRPDGDARREPRRAGNEAAARRPRREGHGCHALPEAKVADPRLKLNLNVGRNDV